MLYYDLTYSPADGGWFFKLYRRSGEPICESTDICETRDKAETAAIAAANWRHQHAKLRKVYGLPISRALAFRRRRNGKDE